MIALRRIAGEPLEFPDLLDQTYEVFNVETGKIFFVGERHACEEKVISSYIKRCERIAKRQNRENENA